MNYSTMKLSTLRKMAKELKVEGYEEMERVDLIKAVKPKDKPQEPKPEPEETTDELKEGTEDQNEPPKGKLATPEEIEEEEKDEPAPEIGISGGHTPVGSKAEMMKAKLALQPKVRIIIPLEGKEKTGATESVILNGYRLNILKGAYVDVPEQVAEIIMESQHQTRIASDELKRLDGRPMKIEGETPSELSK